MSAQLLQLAIFRPEIVSPFADAMRFVDRDLRDVPVQRALQKSVEHQPLRREVEHPVLTTIQSA